MLTVSLVDELVYHPLAQQGVLRVALNCPKYSGGECYPHNSKTEKPLDTKCKIRKLQFLEAIIVSWD